MNFAKGSYGREFVNQTGEIFPELGKMQEFNVQMLHAVESSLDDALRNVEVNTALLKERCACSIRRADPGGQLGELCLAAISMTISYLVVVLASVIRADLDPNAEGFIPLYLRKLQLWQKIRRNQQADPL